MILDKLTEFSEAQTVDVAAVSENVINLYAAELENLVTDQGAGEAVHVVVNSLDKTAAGKLDVELVTATKADLSDAVVLLATGEQAVAGAGEVASFKLPSGRYQRYLALRYKPATDAANLVIHAGMAKDVQVNRAYAAGSEII